MKVPWSKKDEPNIQFESTKHFLAQQKIVSSLFSIDKDEIFRMEQDIKNFNPNLTQMAIINNLVIYLYPKLGLDIDQLRCVVIYIIHEYLEQYDIFPQKLAMLEIDDRYEKLNLLKLEMVEKLNDVFIPKTPDKPSPYIQKIIENYIDSYLD